MLEVHISKHSLFRLKITVGCPLCAYPSIHIETPSRSRSVAWQVHIQAFYKKLSRSRSVVWRTHIRAFTFLLVWTLQITVGCLLCMCPSIRFSPGAGTLSCVVCCVACCWLVGCRGWLVCWLVGWASCRPPGTRTGRRWGRRSTPGVQACRHVQNKSANLG